MHDVFTAALEDHQSVVTRSRRVFSRELPELASLLVSVLRSGGTVFTAGNGGSASDALHFVAELVGHFERDRPPVKAIALGVDAPTTTAICNDGSFVDVLARQVEALASPEDLLVVLTTSGTSPNVIGAARAASTRGCAVAALTGQNVAELAPWCEVLVSIPSTNTARIQEMHGLCLHALAAAVDEASELR